MSPSFLIKMFVYRDFHFILANIDKRCVSISGNRIDQYELFVCCRLVCLWTPPRNNTLIDLDYVNRIAETPYLSMRNDKDNDNIGGVIWDYSDFGCDPGDSN